MEHVRNGGRERERERERERHPRRWDHTRRPRHLLDTAWACRVPRTRGTQHCTLLGAVPRRVVPPPRPRATLWSGRIACDSNRHRHTAPRVRCELHRERKQKEMGGRERERERVVPLESRGKADRVLGVIGG